MKIRSIFIALLMIFTFTFSINVFAQDEIGYSYRNSITGDEEDDFSLYKSKYESAYNNRQTVNGRDYVTIYGHSECNGSSCTYSYARYGGTTTSDFKEALKSNVICSNNEAALKPQLAGSGGDDFKTTPSDSFSGEVYWTENYYVECTNDTSGSSTVVFTISSNSDSGSNNYSNSDSSDYDTSSTTDNKETGVESYFIVLTVIAFASYLLMMGAKKFNLFKKI